MINILFIEDNVMSFSFVLFITDHEKTYVLFAEDHEITSANDSAMTDVLFIETDIITEVLFVIIINYPIMLLEDASMGM